MKKLYVACALLLFVALSACNKEDAAAQEGTYTVTQIGSETVKAPVPILVTYTGDRLAGKGPVNNWSVPVLEDGKLGAGISTRMAGAPELMQMEHTLLQALDGGTLRSAAGNSLIVEKNGVMVIRMQPTPAPDTATKKTP